MKKEDILKKIFNTSFEKLVPSYVFRSELVMVSEDEFRKLMRHKQIDENGNSHDTLVIGEYVFKKQKTKIINIK